MHITRIATRFIDRPTTPHRRRNRPPLPAPLVAPRHRTIRHRPPRPPQRRPCQRVDGPRRRRTRHRLGLGKGTGRQSPMIRTFTRLDRYRFGPYDIEPGHPDADPCISLWSTVGLVPERITRHWPASMQHAHSIDSSQHSTEQRRSHTPRVGGRRSRSPASTRSQQCQVAVDGCRHGPPGRHDPHRITRPMGHALAHPRHRGTCSTPATPSPAPPTAAPTPSALFLDALERGFPTADYATFNQYRKAGAQVRKGERAAYVIKWVTPKNRTDTRPRRRPRGDRRAPARPQGLRRVQRPPGRRPRTPTRTHHRHPRRSNGSPHIGADVIYGGDRAYYAPRRRPDLPPPPRPVRRRRSVPGHLPARTCPLDRPPLAASTGSTSPPRSGAPSTPPRNSSPSSAPPSPPPASGSAPNPETTTPPIWRTGSSSSARTPRSCSAPPPQHNEPSTTSTTSPPAPRTATRRAA